MLKEKWQQLGLEKRLRAIYGKYERFFVPGFLVIGFIFDVVTFRTLQMRTTLQLLMAYSVMVGSVLAYTHIYDARKTPPKFALFSYLRFAAPFAGQISVGALLSSALLFYWFSGSFSVSWPLFALITGVMISSEILREVYSKPAVQMGVYNFVLLSFFSVLLPFMFRSLSGWIFILSGVMSTLFVLLLTLVISAFSERFRRQRSQLFAAITFVFVLMSSFYFFRLIPPLPLAIREAGVYHDVIRHPTEYVLVGEDETVWQSLLPGQVLHADMADSIYAYTVIFVPAQLTTEIYHHWEYKDPLSGKWVDRGLLHFPVKGGRQQGFRGYTTKTGLNPGKWRVTVQNDRGQVLGRLPFTVVTP